jgi:hypothetical protein
MLAGASFLVILPISFRPFDVRGLAFFRTRDEDDNDRSAVLAEVDPVSRAIVDPQFPYGLEMLDVAEVPALDPGQTLIDGDPGPDIL